MAPQTGSLLVKGVALGLILIPGAGVLLPYLDGQVSVLYGFVLAPAAMLALLGASAWLARQRLPGGFPARRLMARTGRRLSAAGAGWRQRLIGTLAHRQLPLDRST